MRRLATKFLLLLGALAFLAGAPVAYAVAPPTVAGQPCPHEHEHMPGTPHKHQHHHDHGAAACLCCCLGTCMGILYGISHRLLGNRHAARQPFHSSRSCTAQTERLNETPLPQGPG
jgi:hypothetical protein